MSVQFLIAWQQPVNLKLPLIAAARLALRPRGTYSEPSLSRCSDDDDREARTSSSDSGSNSSYRSSVASDDTASSVLSGVFLALRPFIFPVLPGTKSSSLSDLPRFFCNHSKVISLYCIFYAIRYNIKCKTNKQILKLFFLLTKYILSYMHLKQTNHTMHKLHICALPV